MARLVDLRTELLTDPLGRGYSLKSDAAAATDLDTKYVSVDRVEMSAAEIFECLVLTEYVALTTKRAQVDTVLGLYGAISVALGSRAREWLMDAYPAGTATRTAFAAVAQYKISRSEQLFGADLVGAFGMRTGEEAVHAARTLPT